MRLALPALFAFAMVSGCSSPEVPTGTTRQAALVSNDLVLSQVYGGGGQANATYDHDFIEIFNRGSSPVQLQGYSVQFAGTGSNFSSANDTYDLPSFSLQPGQYFLIQLHTAGNVGMALPSPDFNAGNTTDITQTNGKVALVLTNNKLNNCGTTNTQCNPSDWVDFVGYGTAQQFEGSAAAPSLSSQKAALRASGGCVDTGDNKSDFTAPVPTPRNSASSTNNCNPDAGSDAGSDADTDAETGADADTDAETGADADTDAEAGSDADTDAEAGADADTDAEAGSDSGADSGADAGDAGPVTLGKLALSQVYGGGGNTMAPYTNDFVEIINRDSMTLDTAGYSVQYASPTGTFSNASNTVDLPSFMLAPGQYFLVELASGGANGQALPTPDTTGSINLGATNGKVALVLTSKKLNGCGTMAMPCQTSDWIDLVGFGTAEQYEGAGAAPAGSNTKSLLRAGDGCIDTDSNTADFTAGAPTPRNSTNMTTCAAADAGPTDGGDGGGSSMDASMEGGPADASSGVDATVDGSKGDAGLPQGEDPGCSCASSSQNGASSSKNGWSALVGLALVVTLRGRRRRPSAREK